jgi:hypothetical protein
MPYPYPQISGNETQNVYTLFKWVNDGVGGIFMPLTLLAIWIIAMVGSISEGRQASRAFIFASFITSTLSILMALIGMLNSQYMYLSFLLVGIGLIWYKLDNAPGT